MEGSIRDRACSTAGRSLDAASSRLADPLSQGFGFFQNAASKQPVEATLGDHVYSPPEQSFQFLDKSGREPRACLFARIHKQVNVTISGRFAAGRRTEDAHVSGSVTVR